MHACSVYDISFIVRAFIFNFLLGEGSFSVRSLLIYDGIHYDPLVKCDQHNNIIQTVFPITDQNVLETAIAMATEANKVSTAWW